MFRALTLDTQASTAGSFSGDGRLRGIADDFVLPIEITGSNCFQDWSYELLFDANVVGPLDVGGLYPSVYLAEFSAADPILWNVTSTGFPGSLNGNARISSGSGETFC